MRQFWAAVSAGNRTLETISSPSPLGELLYVSPDELAVLVEVFLNAAWTELNFCRAFICGNLSIARSRRRKGRCDFAALPEGTVDELVKPANKDRLTAILTLHV